MSEKLTLQDGRQALAEHAREKGAEIRSKYGSRLGYPALLRLLEDREQVRFPTRLQFDTRRIEPGTFAMVEPEGDAPNDGYVVTLHGHFENRPEDIPPLVLYQLVIVNYGDFATHGDAEAFGAAVLGMTEDAYYSLIGRLVDEIPMAE